MTVNYIDSLVATSPDPIAFVGSPNLVILPSGRYVTSVDEWADDPGDWDRKSKVHTSDDNGDTWIYRETIDTYWGKLISNGGNVYHVGVILNTGELAVSKSSDGGNTWSTPVVIRTGDHHGSPTSFIIRDNKVYLSFDVLDTAFFSKVFIAVGDLAVDLALPSAWVFSNEEPLAGIPDYLRWGLHVASDVPKIGSLEGNVVDVDGQIKIFSRLRTGGIANFAAVYSVSDDAIPVVTFESVTPWVGGQNKFHVERDGNGFFWMASCVATNHLQDKATLNATGFKGPPSNERRILCLWYSVDCMNWLPTPIAASGPSVLDAYSYPYSVISGNNMLLMLRVASGAINQHDTNKIQLLKVENFRELTNPNINPLPQKVVTMTQSNPVNLKLVIPNNTAAKVEFDLAGKAYAFGIMSVVSGDSTARGSFRFRVGSSPAFNGIPSLESLSGIEINNTILGGATGNTGALTIGCASDGAVYFENRTGSEKELVLLGSSSCALL